MRQFIRKNIWAVAPVVFACGTGSSGKSFEQQ